MKFYYLKLMFVVFVFWLGIYRFLWDFELFDFYLCFLGGDGGGLNYISFVLGCLMSCNVI